MFAYYYSDIGNVQAAHGRASAVATALKRAHPESILISYQGDGDLAGAGLHSCRTTASFSFPSRALARDPTRGEEFCD